MKNSNLPETIESYTKNKDNKKLSDPKLVMRIPTLDELKKMLMEMNNDKVVELSYGIFDRQSIQNFQQLILY